MRTGKEIKALNDWKRLAQTSLQEKLSLWAMLGVAQRALMQMETPEALKAIADMEAIAKKYELAELVRLMANKHSFEVGPIGDIAFELPAGSPTDEELALEIELIEEQLKAKNT